MKQAAKKYVDKKVIQVTTENYMEVMEVIYDYPDQFAGKTIELTGFVYNDPNNKNSQFLFRFGIVHCIADSGVYGLLNDGGLRSISKTIPGSMQKEPCPLNTTSSSNKACLFSTLRIVKPLHNQIILMSTASFNGETKFLQEVLKPV